MTVTEMVKERNLPELLDREKMIEILLKDQYGYMRDLEYTMEVSEPVMVEARYCDRTVQHSYVNMTFTTKHGSHTMPVHRVLHVDGSKNPFFILLNFRSNVPDRYFPTEEIAEAGFDVLSVGVDDITTDDNDFTNGIPTIFIPNGRERDDDCGKLVYWAWAASRILDYAQTLPSLDLNQAAVVGHSRLGKTALVASMLDTRFRYAFSNDSGCSGASLARGNTGIEPMKNYDPEHVFDYEIIYGVRGETIRDIVKEFPFFSCKNYHRFVYDNIPEGFDQHFLVASIAPRFAYIASATKDIWADPVSEFLCGVAASEAYEKMGLKGLVHNEKLPEVGECFHEGRIGYHLRQGPHFFSRHDWHNYMAYIRKHQFD